ncbi:hypothetical protein DLD77_04210 [Chitinophaga alhagiae]|uniref:ABC transporter permease n=1 Tax=Chitinophaga alhagiae TaxID=2203219 RepID=A0ABN5LNM2_9BACT|nr:hypothetical protein [Chitinophaga alhagiae]AWO00960.1 hypothetical protein DLD77_04210 [Chitinophaga alhagiae]
MQFSFSRFIHLCRLQLAANRKLYLLGMAALAGMLLAFMLFFLITDDELSYNTQQTIYMIGLVLSSGVFTTTIFKQYAEKSQRTQALMLPVSALEKMVLAVLLTLVVYPLVYTVICLSCLKVMNYIDIYWLGNPNALYWLNASYTPGLLIMYVYVQSFVLLGAIWFRKQTFVKSAVMICLIIIGIHAVHSFLGRKIIGSAQPANVEAVGQKLGATGISNFRYDGGMPYINTLLTASAKINGKWDTEYYMVELPRPGFAIMATVLILVPFFLWFITLLKLREQQL